MSTWSEWQTALLDWSEGLGYPGLGILSFTEAIIQPVPPDLLFMPMLVRADTPTVIVALWLTVTLASVTGSLIGYWFGTRWGRPLLSRFAKDSTVARFDVLLEKYGTLGVFIAAFSPIPYKVMGWAAGMGRIDRTHFLLAGLVGRGLRFGLEAVAIGVYGEAFMSHLESPWFAVSTLACALLLIPLWMWWKGLIPEEQTDSESDATNLEDANSIKTD
jgi:undecaprenyl-diphosphatase